VLQLFWGSPCLLQINNVVVNYYLFSVTAVIPSLLQLNWFTQVYRTPPNQGTKKAVGKDSLFLLVSNVA